MAAKAALEAALDDESVRVGAVLAGPLHIDLPPAHSHLLPSIGLAAAVAHCRMKRHP